MNNKYILFCGALLGLIQVPLIGKEDIVITSSTEYSTESGVVDRVLTWVDSLSGSKKNSTTFFGITAEPVPRVLRDYISIPEGVGLLLPRIVKDSPAEAAGLIDNDILIEFDGQLIVNFSQLSTLIDLKGPGATVALVILRKGEELNLEVTLGERPSRGSMRGVPETPEAPPVPGDPRSQLDVEKIKDSIAKALAKAEGLSEEAAQMTKAEVERSIEESKVEAMRSIEESVVEAMRSIEEWIPGSVRVLIDEDQQVHVDLSDMKEDLTSLRLKLHSINLDDERAWKDLVKEYGDLGARKTIVMMGDKNFKFSNVNGKVRMENAGEDQWVEVMNPNGEVIYSGKLPEDYKSSVPTEAVNLINEMLESRKNLELDNLDDIDIEFNAEESDPVTLASPRR